MSIPYSWDDGGREAAGFKGDTGDCVVRAICIATGADYREVYDDLFALSKLHEGEKAQSPRNGVRKKLYKPYMEETFGAVWVPKMSRGTGCTTHLKEGELPAKGNLVVRLSRHLAAVIDGELRDTYDCSRDGTRCVYGYWTF